MRILITFIFFFSFLTSYSQIEKRPFDYKDVFDLKYASNPKISPDGKEIIYTKNSFDIMKDRKVGELWVINSDGTGNRKLTNLSHGESQAAWSHDGTRIAFSSRTDEGSEIHILWKESGVIATISQLEASPSGLMWSPDDEYIAFKMFVSGKAPSLDLPKISAPKGSEWAKKPRLTTRLNHEADGRGYLKDGFMHIFIIPAEGGKVRQCTSGNFNHGGGMSWLKDNKHIVFSANREDDREYQFRNSNIYKVNVESLEVAQLSANFGPESSPKVSPNGKFIAYTGFDDNIRTYQITNLYVMNIDGSSKTSWTAKLDRSVKSFQWKENSKGIVFSYDDFGVTKIASISNGGMMKQLAENMGGTTVGRPYASGQLDLSPKGQLVFTITNPYHLGDIAILNKQGKLQRLTNLNKELDKVIEWGKVEDIRYKSSVDGREIQGWVIYPPDYEKGKPSPLLVENHGGPILNYGERFSAELQLYASKGYVVFYPNPRGSTSYGEEFGDLLYNNYPGDDYQDVMDGVDELIKRGITSENQLYVTGGSAGGIMTAWIIGKNDRFQAAVVHKPVMNWISKTLVADNYYGYANYRYPNQPWENFETYWKFSPISLVGNVETPTMVMVGMNDLRTPPSEAKQLYHALKLRKIETMLVEIPGASHGIASRPSNLINKVAYTISWCDKYRK
jgi:dipeptidyl aminopeptidase/acylaminoacyl peptidase